MRYLKKDLTYIKKWKNEKMINLIISNYSLVDLNKRWKKYNTTDPMMIKRLISRMNGLVDEEIRFEGNDKRVNFKKYKNWFKQSKIRIHGWMK